MTSPLLNTKLYVPPVRPNSVPRPQLLARLDAGLHRKITLISAPAGSGKTTLASAWFSRLHQAIGSEAAPRDVAWLSLDDGDNDLARFLAYVRAALGSIDPSLGQAVEHLLQAPQLPPAQLLITHLINDLAGRPVPLVLALDDYHTINDLAVHEAVGLLVERQPPNLHLVLITRHDPPLPLPRLRARDQVTEIRQRDLRFDAEEAAQFLLESMDLPLAPKQVALLESRTEGWITGLQLAALSMQGRSAESIAKFIAGFSGRYPSLLDYLTDEVLGRQPEELQTFLLRTSILERLSGPLCDALLIDSGRTSSPGQSLLERLERANLFLVPMDDEHRWYRYHALFGELLQARLQETAPEHVPELHRRAAGWYEQAGLSTQAVRHALATQDSQLAAGVIERTVVQLSTWSRADIAMIRRWLQALPEDVVRERPWLRLFSSRTLYVSGQVEAASRVLQELDEWLQDHPETPEAGRLSGLVTVDRASYAVVLGDVRQARALAAQVMSSRPADDPIARFRTPAILGMAALRAGEVVEAERLFSQALDITLEAGLNFAAVPFCCNLAETQIAQGRLRQALRTCERALQLGTVGDAPMFVTGFVGLEMGKLLYEWNALPAAEQQLSQGLELLVQGGISESFGSIHAVLALVKQALGDEAGAADAAGQAVERARRDGIPRLRILASAYQARLWLAQGRRDLAAAWARDYQQAGQTEYLREFEDLTLARVRLAEGRHADTLTLLDALLAPAAAAGRRGTVIEIQALRALSLYALDELEDALDALEQALTLAEPEGYVRLFVDMGRPMAALLKAAGSRGILPQYVGQMLAAWSPHATPRPDLDQQPLVEPLSARELEVLQLLAEGLPNREIGRRLFISLPTVKSHTRNIYGKLGVSSRDEAVARARALAILP